MTRPAEGIQITIRNPEQLQNKRVNIKKKKVTNIHNKEET